MPGICLIFDNQTKQTINGIYDNINQKLGLEVLKIDKNLEPHFTLLYHSNSVDIGDKTKLYENIDILANQVSKRNIKIEGYGIFQRGDNCILYLSTSYDTEFQKVHKKAWEIFNGYQFNKELYHYSSYVPHLTIPLTNTDIDTAMKVLKELMKNDLSNIILNNIKIGYLTANLKNPELFYSQELLK
jgi:2'-5' RNA ligase